MDYGYQQFLAAMKRDEAAVKAFAHGCARAKRAAQWSARCDALRQKLRSIGWAIAYPILVLLLLAVIARREDDCP